MEQRDIVRAVIFREGVQGLEYFLLEKMKSSGEWYHTQLQGGLDGLDPLSAAVTEVGEEIGVHRGYYFVDTLCHLEPYVTTRGPEKTETKTVPYGVAVLLVDDHNMVFEDKHRDGGWHSRERVVELLVRFPEQRPLFEAVCTRLEQALHEGGLAQLRTYNPPGETYAPI